LLEISLVSLIGTSQTLVESSLGAVILYCLK